MEQPDPRFALVREWLTQDLKLPPAGLVPASSDASFRRYFRASFADGTRIVMDAPPPHEDVRPYLQVAGMLESIGVHVPRVYAQDAERGLLLLEDLGSRQYLPELAGTGDADALYGAALATLATIQTKGLDAAQRLPLYDRAVLMREMSLMPEWFCARHLGLSWDPREQAIIDSAFEFLVREALAQPRVLVHRDYHSRNLMLTEHASPGVIDFQDALLGPLGYDLVSLLKDCYIEWPRARVEQWALGYREELLRRGMAAGRDAREFLRWFDLIGLQRHIKVLGIFARLRYRDGKAGYLKDLPLTLRYVSEASARYAALHDFADLVQRRIVPALPAANARALAQASA